MRKESLSGQIRQLSKVVVQLQSQVTELETTHRLYAVRHTCIRCLAEGLQAFQALQAGRALNDHTEAAADAAASQSLLSEEAQLLQQLADSSSSTPSCSNSSSTSTTSCVLDMGISTICPSSDPMLLFRTLLEEASEQQGSSPTPEMTAEQLAQQVWQMFCQLGVQLTKLSASPAAGEAAAAIKDIEDRYLRTIMGMVLAGKPEVLAALQTYNLETMQSDPSFIQAATEATLRVAPELGLTEQQAYAISTGMDLYLGLMEGIQAEQVCIKLALTTLGPAPNASQACSTSADIDNHAVQLEEQQQLYQLLQLLLQKEYFLQFAMCGWVTGRLIYDQLARASVLCLPYVIRLTNLGVGIQKWYKEQQQQQQRQKQQAKDAPKQPRCSAKQSC